LSQNAPVHSSAYRGPYTFDAQYLSWSALGARCFIAASLFIVFGSTVPVFPAQSAKTPTSASQTNSNTPQGTAAAPLTSDQSPQQTIPLPQITDQSEQLDRRLREFARQMPSTTELLAEQRSTEAHAEEILQRSLEVNQLLEGAPTTLEIEDEQRYWRSRGYTYAERRKLLTDRAAQLEQQILFLDTQMLRWQATLQQIQQREGIGTLVERTRRALEGIQSGRAQAQERLNLVLTVHDKVSELDQQISDTRARLREFRDQSRGQLLHLQGPPLWRMRQLRQLERSAGPVTHWPFERSSTAAAEFLRAHIPSTLLLLSIYFLVVLGAFALRRWFERGSHEGVPPEALQILSYPFSVALVVASLGTGSYVQSSPMGIALILYLLYLIPVLRLLVPMVAPLFRTLLYLLAVYYGFAVLFLLIQLAPLLRRELFAVIVLVALLSFGWAARPSRLRQISAQSQGSRLLAMAIRCGLLLLSISLAANIIGFVSLAQILGLATFLGAFLAAALYCATRVLALGLLLVVRNDLARRFLESRTDTIERWGRRVLNCGALLLWLAAMLQLFTVYDSVMHALSGALQYRLGFERIHITLAGVFSFILILLLGYALANAIAFVLRTLLIVRFRAHRGFPFAISQLSYYALLVAVFLAALVNAGIDLNRFTVITGALGVGVGFGLQNIVNNFVSGLVLLLEQPIHVGDVVDVGGVVGTVRRIGARSSTVLTFQGAEVIVPNSNLLSDQVINWTLASPSRRVEITVGVAYGSDIERVLRLLVEVAKSHPGVLQERPPTAFFLGFGESALNFELRFWSAEHAAWFQLKSDIASGVAKALQEANISIPFPQRELHVHNIGASLGDAFTGDGQPTETPAHAPATNRSRVASPPSAPIK
jgi:potassium-dependent mechanosensitive channel